MNVLIVNTSRDTGGAAIAAGRLAVALDQSGVGVRMLVRDASQTDSLTAVLPPTWRHKMRFVWERGVIWLNNGFKRDNLFAVDIANVGTDITRLPEFRKADIIHLHWVNQGMLSLNVIGRILRSGKPVVWTMHDMWPFTGICHYADACTRFTKVCSNCPQLNGRGRRADLAWRTFCKKKQIYSLAPVAFVGCSRWLADKARSASLMAGHRVTDIPNPIDTDLFAPADKTAARQRLGLDPTRNYILFTAMKVTDPRKGFALLRDSIGLWAKQNPALAADTSLIIVGRNADALSGDFAVDVKPFNYVTDTATMVDLYNAATIYVTPSQQDNLPNTIMEALSCGVPCVGFDIGGIPEMIDNGKNGLVVDCEGDMTENFAQAINTALQPSANSAMALAAREKTLRCYAMPVVAQQYINLYNSLLNGNDTIS